ncbi:MAG: hypothetical protein HXY18_12090 [Bryobacteraceae bacterium]|nr:hypothetical protein [Bryobacteraceae bacterium]
MSVTGWRDCGRIALLVAVALGTWNASAQELTREQKEQFLRTAKVVSTRGTSKGVTGVLRATLRSEDGSLTHEAAISRIDEKKPQFQTDRGTELNFRDTYKFNIAAYRLSVLLGLDMVPPHVERSHAGSTSSFCWWVDDVLMDEGERLKKKAKPPDLNDFNAQYSIVQVFDQLIYNVDRNQGNLLITKDWKLWMIDHGRAFRLHHTLENPKVLKMCERNLLAKMKALDQPALKRELGPYLTDMEIQGLLKRRDRIVAFFDKAGESALYSYAGRR